MPYNSVTEHPGPLKLSMVSTLIFGLVSKSVDRISKFALIKKLGKKFKFFGQGRGPPSWIPPSWVHPWLPFTPWLPWYQAWFPWKYRGFCTKVPSFDHVTHMTGLGDLLWLLQNPYISILLKINPTFQFSSEYQITYSCLGYDSHSFLKHQ